jgi:hypothetical protein
LKSVGEVVPGIGVIDEVEKAIEAGIHAFGSKFGFIGRGFRKAVNLVRRKKNEPEPAVAANGDEGVIA